MTQKKAEPISTDYIKIERKKSTRIENAPHDLYDPNKPRLGRRESEPHSNEVNYIYDVLSTNFLEHKTLWDLNHYFMGSKGPIKGKKINIQFDISFFKDFNIPHTISSYDAHKYNGKIHGCDRHSCRYGYGINDSFPDSAFRRASCRHINTFHSNCSFSIPRKLSCCSNNISLSRILQNGKKECNSQ